MNILIVIATILVFGLIGGIINAIRTNVDKKEYWKSLVKGVGAALLVPIFLEIIKSDIGRDLDSNLYDYIVFGGFCLITAIFSDKFIDTIGDKILQSARNAEKIVKENDKKIDVVITREADIPNEEINIEEEIDFISKDFGENEQTVKKVLIALNSNKYKYRTIQGISKETKLSLVIVKTALNFLMLKNRIKSIESSKGTLYTINL